MAEAHGIPIFIIGDVAIDWLAAKWEYPPDERGGPFWQHMTQTQMQAMLSGAWLLENFLLRIGPEATNPHDYYCYERPAPLPTQGGSPSYGSTRRTANPEEYLHSFTELELFDRGDNSPDGHCPWIGAHQCHVNAPAQKVYRIRHYSYFYGPSESSKPPTERPGKESLRKRRATVTPVAHGAIERYRIYDPDLPVQPDEYIRAKDQHVKLAEAAINQPHVLAIYDGNQAVFRDDPNCWKAFLPDNAPDSLKHIVVFQRPFYPGDGHSLLWKQLVDRYADRLTIVLTGDSLRRSGVNISRSLSWERTFFDSLNELNTHPHLQQLAKARHLVIRFGLTGAIHCFRPLNGEERIVTGYYDVHHVEGEYRQPKRFGHMSGLSSLMTATIVRAVADAVASEQDSLSCDVVQRGLHLALLNCRALYCHGFGSLDPKTARPTSVLDLEVQDRWNDELLDESALAGSTFATCKLQRSLMSDDWRFLNLPNEHEAEYLAERIAELGLANAIGSNEARQFPMKQFGRLWVIDRDELESFRSIRNLLKAHAETRSKVPLSIAVFGPPGSGKSFGVREIVKSLGTAADSIAFLTYNLTHFEGPKDLAQALLPVRDAALDNRLAVVFFDEFDTAIGDVAHGWLKYFLPVMQDGHFKHGETLLSVGGPVFVFAGGTKHTYATFCEAKEKDEIAFKNVKGPDFISRLRGFVNIRGIDSAEGTDADHEGPVYMIRRAIFLRSVMWEKYRKLFSGNKEETSRLNIDRQVLHALLTVKNYSHGARSLEAILGMSQLANVSTFDASRLPSESQLEMHIVDIKDFMRRLRSPPSQKKD